MVAAIGCMAIVLSGVQTPVAHGQTYSALVSFSGSSGSYLGANPSDNLTLNGSTLYGTTTNSGANGNYGTIFSVNTDGGGFQTLLSFSGSNGSHPYGGLTLDGSTLYGTTTTQTGSNGNFGNIFSINASGSGFQSVLSFSGSGGAYAGKEPTSTLAFDGSTLYGMTTSGGSIGFGGNGTIFSFNPSSSSFQSLMSFNGGNGKYPDGSLILVGTTLYGMTSQGGTGDGNIFSIGIDGTGYKSLLSFSGSNGADPEGSLIFNGSTLYGMTQYGGAKSNGSFYSGDGTIFSINTDGTGIKTLLSFSGTNGGWPGGSLILSGTTLYGATSGGGSTGDGTIFSIGTDGTGFQTLLTFSGTGGAYPGTSPLGNFTLVGSTLYGMTNQGGATTKALSSPWGRTSRWPPPRLPP